MHPRVIILEDDEDSRRILAMVLERRGYEVVSAAEPLSCPLYTDLDARCTHEFPCGDFLLSDNHMPRMTGLQFVARQKERGCKGAIRNKAILSGTWDLQELETAARLGCKVFTKPYNLNDIYRWLMERRKKLPAGRKLTALGDL